MVCSIDLKYYEILQFNFAVFHLICDVWPLQLLIKNSVFYYNICGFSAERPGEAASSPQRGPR